jgi:hypothetical protein
MFSSMERFARAHRSLLPSYILATASLTVQQVMIPARAILTRTRFRLYCRGREKGDEAHAAPGS